METFERTLRVPGTLADVWAFHSTLDGLRSLTPGFLNLRVDELEQPENGQSHVLTEGTRIHASVTPLGFGPRTHWTSHIEERVERDGVAYFVDAMEDGPLPEWRHTHVFYGDGDETLIRDRVEYSAPGGRVGDRLVKPVLAAGFYYRHRRTSEIFDGP